LRQLIVASERITKKTAVSSIVACEFVATQCPFSVDFVGPQRACHTIEKVKGKENMEKRKPLCFMFNVCTFVFQVVLL
jgi:hypothetical protein